LGTLRNLWDLLSCFNIYEENMGHGFETFVRLIFFPSFSFFW
jgi:hypothetical protein